MTDLFTLRRQQRKEVVWGFGREKEDDKRCGGTRVRRTAGGGGGGKDGSQFGQDENQYLVVEHHLWGPSLHQWE